MSHETCEHCDKPLRLCACTGDYDGPKYIGPTDCAFCGEALDDPEEDGPKLRDAAQLLADLKTLGDWLELDESHSADHEHVNGAHYITLWPDGEVCTDLHGSSQRGALATAAAWVRENTTGEKA
jgi:hypothetical protein